MVKPWQSLYQMVALKKENSSSLTEFNRIVDGLWPDDTIGHFFMVDIKFSNINPKTLLNELYPPIFNPPNSNIFNDDTFRKFFSPSLLREEIIQTFQSKFFSLNKEESMCKARKKILWETNGGKIRRSRFSQKNPKK